jgi:peptidyl-tRNA hydrolase/pyrrolidone-carboxylate peptidase
MDRPFSYTLTGFGPFAGVAENPTSLLITGTLLPKALAARSLPPPRSATVVDVSRPSASAAAARAHAALPPGVHVALHLGVAASASEFHVEACAVNDATFRVPDALGEQPRGEPISPARPLGAPLRTTVAVPALVAALAARWGGRVCASEDAGRFLCNFIYHASLEAAERAGAGSHALFIHVPLAATIPLEEQAEFVADACAALREQLCGGAGGGVAAGAQGASCASAGAAAAAAAALSKDGVVAPPPPAQAQAMELGFDAAAVAAAAAALGAGADAEALISWVLERAEGAAAAAAATASAPALDLSSLSLAGAASRVKLVLVVRRDLGMSGGKVAAQCVHAALKAHRAGASRGAARAGALQREWEALGEPVVVLGLGAPAAGGGDAAGGGAGEGALLALAAAAAAAGVPAATVRDAGRTQVAPGSLTVLALGPAREADIDALTGGLKLL